MNQAARRLVAAFLALAALLFFLIGLVGYEEPVAHSVENSRNIAGKFALAAARIENFRIRQRALPTSEQFDRLFADQQGQPYIYSLSRPGDTDCDGQAEKFRALPDDVYVLTVWRGEWYECAAPQRGLTTLLVEPDQYYITSHPLLDQVFWIAAAFGLLAAARILWCHRPEAKR